MEEDKKMTADEAAASLALATNLSEQMMMQDQAMQEPMTEEQSPEDAPETTETTEPQEDKPDEIEGLKTEINSVREEMTKGFEELKNVMMTDEQKEIESIKEELKSLNNDEKGEA